MIDPPRFTPREREVVDLVRSGMTNPQIAAALGIATGTVKVHLKRCFEAAGVWNRREL